MEHSTTVSGSNADRFLNCTSWREVAAKAPKAPESEYAKRGTEMHTYIADKLDGIKSKVVLEDGELEDKIEPALEAFKKLCKDLKIVNFVQENRVSLEGYIPDSFGWADILGVTESGELVDVDWKFGDGVPVFAEENGQMMFYAAAATETPAVMEMLGIEDVNMIPKVHMVIIQPSPNKAEIISHWETDIHAIDRFKLELVKAWNRSQSGEKIVKKGAWCKFCPGKLVCPETTRIPKDLKEALRKDPNELTDDQVGQLAKNIPVWEKAIKEFKALILDRLEHGGQATGFKLVNKQARRQWSDEDGAAEIAFTFSGLPEDAIYSKALLSVAQMEKLFKKEDLDFSILADCITAKSSGFTYAPESDKRPAVHTGAAITDELRQKLKGAK